jgi:hypothetical protein
MDRLSCGVPAHILFRLNKNNIGTSQQANKPHDGFKACFGD